MFMVYLKQELKYKRIYVNRVNGEIEASKAENTTVIGVYYYKYTYINII